MHRSLRPRSARTVALAPVAALLLAGCGGGESASGTPEGAKAAGSTGSGDVTINVGVQKDGVRSILEKSGALEGAPYRISWSTFQFGPPIVEAATAGAIDTGSVGSTPPIFGAAAQGDFKVIAERQTDRRSENALIVKKGSDIRSVGDLVGKDVAVPKGSSAQGFILNALKREGVPSDRVTFRFLPPADGLAAFKTDRVDAWAIWEPFVTQAEQDADARPIIDGEPDEGGTLFQIASQDALDDEAKRPLLADYVGRVAKAYRWAAENEDAWAAAWSEESGLPLRTTKAAVRRMNARIAPLRPETLARQQRLADLLKAEDVIPKAVTFRDVVDLGVYDAAAARRSEEASTR